MSDTPVTLVGNPQLKYVLDAHGRQLSRDLNCMLPAKIVSFDPAKNTASVTLMVKRQFVDGTTITFPPIADCPVITLGGGSAWLEMPISAGDDCLVLFADRSIDNWYSSGELAVPDLNRAHAFSDAFVLVGVKPATRALALTGDHVGLHAKQWKLIIDNNDCSVSLDNGVKVDAKTKKVRIKNNAKNLKTLVDSLFTLLNTIQVDPGTHKILPAVTEPLDLLKAEFAQLLET